MVDKKDDLIRIAGAGNVFDSPQILDAYSRDQSFVPPMKPWLLVKPASAVEVQEIVKWANRTQTPLVPTSSGPPRFHGDTVPSVPGAVMVDLSRMTKILRIDAKNRMAVVEPGVTYGHLRAALDKEGLDLSSPLLPRANKSVITSLLERQPTLVPKYHWSLQEPLRCMEVVWERRDLMDRRGWYGNPFPGQAVGAQGSAQIDPRGPGETDWHRIVSGSQGTLGIVTWASVKCEVLPKVHKLYFVPARRVDDLIDCAYRLLRLRLGDEFLILNHAMLASVLGDDSAKIRSLAQELPPWVIIIGIAGRDILPERKVETQELDIRDIVQQFGLQLAPAIPGASGQQVLGALLQPSREPYWKTVYKGAFQDIFFLTLLNKTPAFIRTMQTLAEAQNYPSSDIGIYIQPQHQGVAYHCEFTLPFNPTHPVEVAKVRRLFTEAGKELMNQGAYFSRPYGGWANNAYNRDAQSTILLKEIKNVFDPAHVLNPGKLCF